MLVESEERVGAPNGSEGGSMRTIAVVAVVGVLAGIGAAPAAGQAQWDSRDIAGGGKEFQLANDDGAVIILACMLNGQAAAFGFPEPIEPTERATVRGVPGGRENVAVTAINDRVLQLAGGRGLNFTFDLLREATSLSVRASGENATFEVFGSNSIIIECLEQEEDRIGQPRRLPE